MSNITELISMAEQTAELKNNQGLLFGGDSDLYHKDWSNGDPETIYTIASMYAQFVENGSAEEAEDKILESLTELYPNLI